MASAAGFRTPFDPEATARLRTGEMVEAIRATGRQVTARPAEGDVLLPALLIQAGLRTLLPPPKRGGLALPGEPGADDPESLIRAQKNLSLVYQSGKEASPDQRAVAKQAIDTAATMLWHEGYLKTASLLWGWLKQVS